MNIATLPAPTAVPSIATSAVLVSLHIGKWSASKKDARASADVARYNNVITANRARAYKTLVASPKLDAINSFVTRAHEINRGMTLDWATSSGLRLCPTAVYPDHTRRMTQLADEYEKLVADFGTDYNMLAVQQQAELGDLYDPADYPSWDRLRSKFYFYTDVMPVSDPTGKDLRLGIAAETEAHIREHYQRMHERAMQQATRGLWERINILLSGDDAGKVGLIQNLDEGGRVSARKLDDAKELVSMLDDLNITGDPVLTSAALKLRKAFANVGDVDTVKSTGAARPVLRKDLEAIKASLPSLDW
jgi:hypothetical protein